MEKSQEIQSKDSNSLDQSRGIDKDKFTFYQERIKDLISTNDLFADLYTRKMQMIKVDLPKVEQAIKLEGNKEDFNKQGESPGKSASIYSSIGFGNQQGNQSDEDIEEISV